MAGMESDSRAGMLVSSLSSTSRIADLSASPTEANCNRYVPYSLLGLPLDSSEYTPLAVCPSRPEPSV